LDEKKEIQMEHDPRQKKRNSIRTDHPLSVLSDLPFSRGDVRNHGRDNPQ
jgi:hypothetical protein